MPVVPGVPGVLEELLVGPELLVVPELLVEPELEMALAVEEVVPQPEREERLAAQQELVRSSRHWKRECCLARQPRQQHLLQLLSPYKVLDAGFQLTRYGSKVLTKWWQ